MIDLVNVCKTMFQGAWNFLGIEVPGLGITFRAVLLGFFGVSIIITFISKVFGTGDSGGAGMRSGGSPKKAKTSKERMDDEI